MRKYLILYIFICFNLNGIGQDNSGKVFQSNDIFTQLKHYGLNQGKVTITQDQEIEHLFNRYVLKNARQPGMNGYRIRIYLDLGQKSRKKSEEIVTEFYEKYPGINVYRTYTSPYYKVSVGDFRTKDNALKLYHQLLKEYPKAFIVPEWINFPPLE
ncbi:MAG: SPOR domain-containing protein [Tenuifilaceae bacterium]